MLGAALLCCGVTACSPATAPPPATETESSESTAERARTSVPDESLHARFREARSAIMQQQGIETRLEVTQDGQAGLSGAAQISGDLLSWRGSFLLGAFPIEVVRIGDTAWVSGPEAYWRSYGVSPEQSAAIGTRYAVFSGESASALIGFADMTVFLQSLSSSLLLNDPLLIESGSHAGMLSVTIEGNEQRFTLSDSDDWLDEVQADLGGGAVSSVSLVPLPTAPAIVTPASADVFPEALKLGAVSNVG